MDEVKFFTRRLPFSNMKVGLPGVVSVSAPVPRLCRCCAPVIVPAYSASPSTS